MCNFILNLVSDPLKLPLLRRLNACSRARRCSSSSSGGTRDRLEEARRGAAPRRPPAVLQAPSSSWGLLLLGIVCLSTLPPLVVKKWKDTHKQTKQL